MTAIPPNWLSSIAGSSGAQHSAGARKAKEAADETDRNAGGKFAESLQNVIESSDKDGEVFSDSEGLGSQGRAPAEDTEPQDTPQPDERPSTDSGLDLQA